MKLKVEDVIICNGENDVIVSTVEGKSFQIALNKSLELEKYIDKTIEISEKDGVYSIKVCK